MHTSHVLVNVLSLPVLLQIVVELIKAPSLGLCITGGTDGENAIKPGDQVSIFPFVQVD